MEQKEIVQILTIKTAESANNVADLKENIKALKQVLDSETATKEENAKAAELLRENQNALRDAMYATTQTTEQLTDKSLKLLDENNNLNGSYNDLVHTMAELKMAWRATNDEAERDALGDEIKAINDQLKKMDASVGNFQRSVGDYKNAIKGAFKSMADSADAFGKGLKATGGGINSIKDASEGLAKSPMIATFAILVSAVMTLTEKFKENEGVMESLKRAMATLQPVMDFFSDIFEKIAVHVADLIGKAVEFLGNSGILAKVQKAVIGVGNTIKEFILMPVNMIVDAIAIFKKKGLAGLREVGNVLRADLKQGTAFKSNFKAGEEIADALVAGAKSKKKETEKELGKVAEDIGKKMADEIQKGFDQALAKANKAFDDELKERLAIQKEIDAMTEDEWERTNAEIEKYLEEQQRMREEDAKDAEEKALERVATMEMVIDTTSDLLSSLADIYEASSKDEEKNAKKIKALRIASATIETIHGAISAFMANATKPVVAAMKAAAVTAAGIAQIAKIKNTSISSSSSGGSGTSNLSAVVSAPITDTTLPSVRNITTQSEEDRLNQMAKDQRVYILSSDIQASNRQSRVQIAESTF